MLPAKHVFAVLALVTASQIAPAQHGHDSIGSVPNYFKFPMPLSPNALGKFTRPISSSNREAQAYFNQGFQLEYAFDKIDAIRSFREAEKRDPDCAICYWGEAWSWGSFLNGPMQPNESPFAFAAIRKARHLAGHHANSEERALIGAMSVRYVEHFDPAKRREQDLAYADAMRKVHERFPSDVDAGTLYGEALFLLEPRRGWRDIRTPNVQRILGVLESVLAIDSRHVGACHLYIHLTEATTDPERAEACADSIGNAIPGASHINHMPSHTWNRLGRWGDSVRANIQAWHSDQKAAIGEAFAIYPSHNLHMLLYAASMDGQGAIAMQAAKDYDKMEGDHIYPILTLIRFGRFDEVLEITKPAAERDAAAVWEFGQGYARLRKGDTAAARAHLNRLLDAAATASGMFRFNSARNVLGTLGGILEGEIYRAGGDLGKAIAAFERAVAQEDAMMYDEPEPLPFAARHWLGAALLEAKDYANAERVYREELKHHPHNGWSLFGLRAALEGQGRPSIEVQKDFETSWARSDTWIRASRF
jgi:tetratricopeptide (TPR) repeat protein